MTCALFPDPKPYPHHWAASAAIHVETQPAPSDKVVWVRFSYKVNGEPRLSKFNFCPEDALKLASELIASAAEAYKQRERESGC